MDKTKAKKILDKFYKAIFENREKIPPGVYGPKKSGFLDEQEEKDQAYKALADKLVNDGDYFEFREEAIKIIAEETKKTTKGASEKSLELQNMLQRIEMIRVSGKPIAGDTGWIEDFQTYHEKEAKSLAEDYKSQMTAILGKNPTDDDKMRYYLLNIVDKKVEENDLILGKNQYDQDVTKRQNINPPQIEEIIPNAISENMYNKNSAVFSKYYEQVNYNVASPELRKKHGLSKGDRIYVLTAYDDATLYSAEAKVDSRELFLYSNNNLKEFGYDKSEREKYRVERIKAKNEVFNALTAAGYDHDGFVDEQLLNLSKHIFKNGDTPLTRKLKEVGINNDVDLRNRMKLYDRGALKDRAKLRGFLPYAAAFNKKSSGQVNMKAGYQFIEDAEHNFDSVVPVLSHELGGHGRDDNPIQNDVFIFEEKSYINKYNLSYGAIQNDEMRKKLYIGLQYPITELYSEIQEYEFKVKKEDWKGENPKGGDFPIIDIPKHLKFMKEYYPPEIAKATLYGMRLSLEIDKAKGFISQGTYNFYVDQVENVFDDDKTDLKKYLEEPGGGKIAFAIPSIANGTVASNDSGSYASGVNGFNSGTISGNIDLAKFNSLSLNDFDSLNSVAGILGGALLNKGNNLAKAKVTGTLRDQLGDSAAATWIIGKVGTNMSEVSTSLAA